MASSTPVLEQDAADVVPRRSQWVLRNDVTREPSSFRLMFTLNAAHSLAPVCR
jgi:hypothetical protein